MHTFLFEYHDIFALEDEDQREMGPIQLEIETENALPNRQHPRRMPFSAREEVAKQLKKMQMAVIQPSKVAMVKPGGIGAKEGWLTQITLS